MLRSIANLLSHHAPTPERQAASALNELRMELFQAEQRALDAELHVDYYRARLAFLEGVSKNGIEHMSDQRKGQRDTPESLRPGLKLTAAQ
jgi:hypothetical protein